MRSYNTNKKFKCCDRCYSTRVVPMPNQLFPVYKCLDCKKVLTNTNSKHGAVA